MKRYGAENGYKLVVRVLWLEVSPHGEGGEFIFMRQTGLR